MQLKYCCNSWCLLSTNNTKFFARLAALEPCPGLISRDLHKKSIVLSFHFGPRLEAWHTWKADTQRKESSRLAVLATFNSQFCLRFLVKQIKSSPNNRHNKIIISWFYKYFPPWKNFKVFFMCHKILGILHIDSRSCKLSCGIYISRPFLHIAVLQLASSQILQKLSFHA